MFESVCLTKVMIIFQDLPIIKRMAQIRRERVCPRDSFFFVIGIIGMIASAVAAVFSARILRRQEKKLKEQIWNEYQ